MGPCVPDRRVEQKIAEILSTVDSVERVYVLPYGQRLTLYTVIPEDQEDAYDAIYIRERSIIRTFQGLHFDFNVIARRGRAMAEIFGSKQPVWERASAESFA